MPSFQNTALSDGALIPVIQLAAAQEQLLTELRIALIK